MFKVGDIVRLTEDAMRRFPERQRGDYVITKIYKDSGDIMIMANGINNNGVIRGMYGYRFELVKRITTNRDKYTT